MTNQIDHIDQITLDDLRHLARTTGTWVTVSMPTHRTGAETRQNPIRFRNLANAALSELASLEVSEVDRAAITDRLDRLARDHEFWQHQTGGLVGFMSAEEEVLFRLPAAVPEAASAAQWPRLTSLVPFIADDTLFRVLVISAERARLLEGTINSLQDVALDQIPGSYDDAFGHVEHQKHLQHSAHPDGSRYHGHGGGSTPATNAQTRYLRAVSAGLDQQLRDQPKAPLVLAGASEVTGEFRQISDQPILDKALPGAHLNTGVHELHEQIWPMVAETHTLPLAEANSRIDAAWARDEALLDLNEIIRAAEQGRVADIFIDPDAVTDATVEQALRLTLQMGGAAHALAQPQGRSAAALLRF